VRRLLSALFAALPLIGIGAKPSNATTSASEQAVIVHFDYGNPDWKPFFKFQERLESAIKRSGAGDYDGNELAVDGSDGTLYMYGPDADKLLAVAKPILLSADFLKNITVTLRYGGVEDKLAREVKVRLSS